MEIQLQRLLGRYCRVCTTCSRFTEMNYFTGCNTAERKLKWKELAKIHHPDVGGDIKVMQEINRQYLEEVKVRRCSGIATIRQNLNHGMLHPKKLNLLNHTGRKII